MWKLRTDSMFQSFYKTSLPLSTSGFLLSLRFEFFFFIAFFSLLF